MITEDDLKAMAVVIGTDGLDRLYALFKARDDAKAAGSVSPKE